MCTVNSKGVSWLLFMKTQNYYCLDDVWMFKNGSIRFFFKLLIRQPLNNHLDGWKQLVLSYVQCPSPTSTLSCFSHHCHRAFGPAMVTLQSTEPGTFTVLGPPDLLYVVTATCPRCRGGGCQDAPSKEVAPLTLCQPRLRRSTGQWKEEDDFLEKKDRLDR